MGLNVIVEFGIGFLKGKINGFAPIVRGLGLPPREGSSLTDLSVIAAILTGLLEMKLSDVLTATGQEA